MFLVEDVILKDSRKKKKASALVVLDSIQAAGQAAHEVLGDLSNPLLVTPYLKIMPEAEQQQRPPAAAAAAAARAGGGPKPAAPVFAAGGTGWGSAGRPVQRPSKPLFPSKCQTNPLSVGCVEVLGLWFIAGRYMQQGFVKCWLRCSDVGSGRQVNVWFVVTTPCA
jgi:hypothetical protein